MNNSTIHTRGSPDSSDSYRQTGAPPNDLTMEAPSPPPRPRPVLRHSNNLHCGGFLDSEQLRNESIYQEGEDLILATTQERLARLGKRKTDEQEHGGHYDGLNQYRHQATLSGAPDDDYFLGRTLIFDHDHEWKRFHEAVRRRRCTSHASIQQLIDEILSVQEQGVPRTGDRNDVPPEASSTDPRYASKDRREEDSHGRELCGICRHVALSSL